MTENCLIGSGAFGKPLPADAGTEGIRLAIEELSCDYFEAKNRHD